jgi:uncharacterized 2Fe-2S/4Fe-4S cluster protein (DUF4445 family)
MSKAYRVTFIDPDTRKTRIGQVEDGASILDAAHRAGEEVSATCGSRGRCRSCRVKIISGNVPPPTIQDGIPLGHEEVQEGFRLACQTKVIGECEVMALPPRAEAGHQILAGDELDADRVTLDSGVVKHVVTANAPKEEHHQTSDTEEILATLPPDTSRDIPLMVLRGIPALLRAEGGALTVTTFNDRIAHIEAGDTSEHRYGMAFDIGTTSIVGNLIDLASGEQLAAVGSVNPQAVYGGDLMSRIAFAQFDDKKLTTLRAKALNAINDFISEACDKAGIDANHIYKPYAPSVREPLVIPARDLPLKSAPHAHICLLPIVAGFVGADTMACVLATRIYESDEIRALVDIGTNGEVVMGSKDKLMACSAPAGPALEGAQIRHGMRGAAGAIEKVEIGEDVELGTVGDVPAIGICGSGLIDACAKMLDAGVLDASGLLRRDRNNEMPEALGKRTVANDQGREFVLAWSEQAGKDENITLTQGDIRQFQLAKSAIYSGIVMLQQVMEVSDEALSELMLCGGFGNYINIASAVNVRLLPELPQEKITYVGNAAALGAQMALLSETERNRAWDLAQTIEHVALAASPDFQTIFIDGMSFGDDANAGRKNEKTGSRRKKAAGAGG